MQNYAHNQYRQTELKTADKGKLIVLLYDGAVKYLHQAKQCIVDKDIVGTCSKINAAQDIITELQYSLDMDNGGIIAEKLFGLYQFMTLHLIKAKIQRDGTDKIDEVIGMLKTLNEGWRAISTQPEAPVVESNEIGACQSLSQGLAV
ncbi:MAG: flagellar export chaperone FliS [Thermodesulfobacteriota bacterium]|nr:flagellar export chaperone FliS [Thermodesulfobacteriota bacterium]